MLTLFLTEAALGSVIAMSAVPVRAAGRLFFRFGAAQSATLILLGLGAGTLTGAGSNASRSLLAAGALLLIVASGLFHVQRTRPGLAVFLGAVPPALLGCLLDAWAVAPADTAGARFAWGIDALSAALVTGSVLMAMILGHFYLNIPGLSSRYLQRLSLFVLAAIAARACVLTVNLIAQRASIGPLLALLLDTGGAAAWNAGGDPFVLVLVLIQIAFGIAVPTAFAIMAWRSACIEATQSATGILYVALIMVIMGELAGRYLVTLARLPI